jgi:hypothetical protein
MNSNKKTSEQQKAFDSKKSFTVFDIDNLEDLELVYGACNKSPTKTKTEK